MNTFHSRWGDKELDDHQYVHIPGFIMRNYHKFTYKGERVGLNADEFQTMAHIMSFKYDTPGAQARPSLQTVADQMGKHVSSVRNSVKKLKAKNAVSVTEIAGKNSVYDFGELVRQCREFERSVDTTPSVDASTSIHTTPTPSVDASTPLAQTLDEELEVRVKEQKQKQDSTEPPTGGDQPAPIEPISTPSGVQDGEEDRDNIQVDAKGEKLLTPFKAGQSAVIKHWFADDWQNAGWAGKLTHMFMGTSEDNGYQEYNFDPPFDADRIDAFGVWLHTKLTEIPTSPEKLVRWKGKFIKEFAPPEPLPFVDFGSYADIQAANEAHRNSPEVVAARNKILERYGYATTDES